MSDGTAGAPAVRRAHRFIVLKGEDKLRVSFADFDEDTRCHHYTIDGRSNPDQTLCSNE